MRSASAYTARIALKSAHGTMARMRATIQLDEAKDGGSASRP
jgi:hypothetical protein